MTSAQKVIKYLAIGFAMALVLAIFSGIVAVGYGIMKGVDLITDYDEPSVSEMQLDGLSSYLDVSLKYSKLVVKSGDKFTIEPGDGDVEIKQDENKVQIVEKRGKLFNHDSNVVTVLVPKDLKFETVDIRTKGGELKIERLLAKDLHLTLGAGAIEIDEVEADKAKIKNGAGKLEIHKGKLNDLDLESGMGEVVIAATITGKSTVECGIGRIGLDLDLKESDYTFEIKKGLGAAHINNREVSDNSIIGTGTNTIKVDGGIGEIDIKTKE